MTPNVICSIFATCAAGRDRVAAKDRLLNTAFSLCTKGSAEFSVLQGFCLFLSSILLHQFKNVAYSLRRENGAAAAYGRDPAAQGKTNRLDARVRNRPVGCNEGLGRIARRSPMRFREALECVHMFAVRFLNSSPRQEPSTLLNGPLKLNTSSDVSRVLSTDRATKVAFTETLTLDTSRLK